MSKETPLPTQQTPQPEKYLNGFALETKLLLFDGSIKSCHEIQAGDILMGDDSTPRHVISVNKVEPSQSILHKITQKKGVNYNVNKDHYLCLKLSRIRTKKDIVKIFDKEYRKKDLIDIRLQDYIKLPKSTQLDFKAYKRSVEFSPLQLPCHPYIIGLWVVDATIQANEIHISSFDILEHCFYILEKHKMALEFVKGNRYAIQYDDTSKSFTDCVLSVLKITETKCIPSIYKINSRENRLLLLAGIIDCEGTINKNCYELTVTNETVVDDIVFLCFSLGFHASKSVQKATHSYRVIISGDLSQIPVIDSKKKMADRKQIKDILHTGIEIEPLTDVVNGCVEFVVDGNGRFLMSDFTVLHS